MSDIILHEVVAVRVNRVGGVRNDYTFSNPVQRKEIIRRNEIEMVIDELARRSLRKRGLLMRIKTFYKAVERSLIDILG